MKTPALWWKPFHALAHRLGWNDAYIDSEPVEDGWVLVGRRCLGCDAFEGLVRMTPAARDRLIARLEAQG